MRFTKVIVTHGETRSFGNHHNIRSSVTYEADLDHDEEGFSPSRRLIALATVNVHKAIDDTLEANERSPVYDTDSLYLALMSNRRKVVIIAPVHEASSLYPVDFFPCGNPMRWDPAFRLADRRAGLAGHKFSGDISSPEDFEELEAPDIPPENWDEIPF